MNYLLLVWTLCIATLAHSQSVTTYTQFSARKKSVGLRTGITMKYIDTGNPTGTPVLLLHGATDTGRSFQLTIEELMRISPTLRIIAPDQRGHGGTSMPDDKSCANAPEKCFTPALFAADIVAFMDQLKLSKVHLVGHSMGSIVAQELALTYKDRLHSLMLIGTFVNGKESASVQEFAISEMIEKQLRTAFEKKPHVQWPKDAYRVTPNELGEEVKKFLRENWVAELGTEQAFLEAVYPETLRVPLGTWIGVMKALGQVDNRQAIKNLQVPTLVLYPIQDMMFTQPDQAQVKSSLESASRKHGTPIFYKTYGKIPLPASGYQESDLGHNLQWVAHKQVAADIVSFVTSGVPVPAIPYLNPQNKMEVLSEKGHTNIISFHQGK